MITFLLALTSLLAGVGKAPAPGNVVDSILGVRVGASFEEAERILEPKGTGGGKEEEEKEEREGGRKAAWKLPSGDFSAVALKADEDGRIVWITGYLRPGCEKPFESLGNLSTAQHNANTAIWNVRAPSGPYRVVAKGGGGKASVVYLIRLEREKE